MCCRVSIKNSKELLGVIEEQRGLTGWKELVMADVHHMYGPVMHTPYCLGKNKPARKLRYLFAGPLTHEDILSGPEISMVEGRALHCYIDVNKNLYSWVTPCVPFLVTTKNFVGASQDIFCNHCVVNEICLTRNAVEFTLIVSSMREWVLPSVLVSNLGYDARIDSATLKGTPIANTLIKQALWTANLEYGSYLYRSLNTIAMNNLIGTPSRFTMQQLQQRQPDELLAASLQNSALVAQ